jgi:hypothetical protein
LELLADRQGVVPLGPETKGPAAAERQREFEGVIDQIVIGICLGGLKMLSHILSC